MKLLQLPKPMLKGSGVISGLLVGLHLTGACHGQAVTPEEALDFPGTWYGDLSSSLTSPGWYGVNTSAAHDHVDAMHGLSTRYQGTRKLKWGLPSSGTVSFWWRYATNSYSNRSVVFTSDGIPIAYPETQTWTKVVATTASPTLLEWQMLDTRNSSAGEVWLDEFGFNANAPNLGLILDAPTLPLITFSRTSEWIYSATETAPGALATGSLRTPASGEGRLITKVTGPGVFSFWWKVTDDPAHPTDYVNASVLQNGGYSPSRNGAFEWQQVVIVRDTYGEFVPEITFYAANYNGSQAAAYLSVDRISWGPETVPWLPGTPVSLAEGLDTTAVVTNSFPNDPAGWRGLADPNLGAVGGDAVVYVPKGFNYHGQFTTTFEGPMRVSFRAQALRAGLEFWIDNTLASSYALGTCSQVDERPGMHTLMWRATGAHTPALSYVLVDELILESLPTPTPVSLAEAMDTPEVTFSAPSETLWTGRMTDQAEHGGDAVVSSYLLSAYVQPPATHWLAANFTTTETSQVTFSMRLTGGPGVVECTVDGVSVAVSLDLGLELGADTDWRGHSFVVGPGNHTIQWRGLLGTWNTESGYSQLWLDHFIVTGLGVASPGAGVDLGDTGGAHIIPYNLLSTWEVVTDESHDHVDSLLITLLPGQTARFSLRPGKQALWARTDGPVGSVNIGDFHIEANQWVPLVRSGALQLSNTSETIAIRVWLDDIQNLSDPDPGLELFATTLDFPALASETVVGEGYFNGSSGPASHDGVDVLVGMQSSSDDRATIDLPITITGPTVLTFWYRLQNPINDEQQQPKGWIEVDNFPRVVLNLGSACGPWRRASAHITAGEHVARIRLIQAPYAQLYLDQLALEPSATAYGYATYAALHDLSGLNAAPTADPDGDGRVNLIEYAFDTDPSVAEAAALHPVLTYTREFHVAYGILQWLTMDGLKVPALEDVSIVLQTSMDLSADGWVDLPVISPQTWTITEDRLKIYFNYYPQTLQDYSAPSRFFRARFDYTP